jgi:hypothetical protein
MLGRKCRAENAQFDGSSVSVSKNGKLSCLEIRGDSLTQQRPVSRLQNKSETLAVEPFGRIDAAHVLQHEPARRLENEVVVFFVWYSDRSTLVCIGGEHVEIYHRQNGSACNRRCVACLCAAGWQSP